MYHPRGQTEVVASCISQRQSERYSTDAVFATCAVYGVDVVDTVKDGTVVNTRIHSPSDATTSRCTTCCDAAVMLVRSGCCVPAILYSSRPRGITEKCEAESRACSSFWHVGWPMLHASSNTCSAFILPQKQLSVCAS